MRTRDVRYVKMASPCNMKWKMKPLMLSFFVAIIILNEANALPEPGKKRIELTEVCIIMLEREERLKKMRK